MRPPRWRDQGWRDGQQPCPGARGISPGQNRRSPAGALGAGDERGGLPQFRRLRRADAEGADAFTIVAPITRLAVVVAASGRRGRRPETHRTREYSR